ncbi:MAG: glycosyltransferase family 4 protein [Candidatus Aminicenantes bacterium]|nr:glycosyltransferase family 4 protein [Candidatus Aminicenantes bacterium]
MQKRIGIVVQRYGSEINGGAEYHAKLIAEKMSKYYEIEVFTTTALNYISWEHHYPEGQENVDGIVINRFDVDKKRNPDNFGKLQDIIFNREHTLDQEIEWLHEEGPYAPKLIAGLEKREKEFDYFIFFSYRYYHSYYGILKFKRKAILVPTAEHDEVIYLRLFKNVFNFPGAIVYNSHEEKQMINQISGNESVPGEIVGVGSEIPGTFSPHSFRKKYDLKESYYVYIGRLDENKGIPELLDFYLRLVSEERSVHTLVLMGKSLIEVPDHPRIRHLGFVSDQDKFDGLKGSDFLIIPSQFESLSMVALEAWAIGKPVIVNGRTDVLQGQCRRSNAGLWYTNYGEFKKVMLMICQDGELRKSLGENGKEFFQKNYSWLVIENKYQHIINRLELNKST